MKYIGLLQTILIHLLGICAGAVLVLRLLDWYNPLMGIMERNIRLVDIMCLCAVALMVITAFFGKPRRKPENEEK